MPRAFKATLLLALCCVAPPALAQFQFSSPQLSPSLFGNLQAEYIREANLNGDAYPDLLISNQLGTMTAINQGPPSFGFATALVSGVGVGTNYASDLDGDGDSDLMIAIFQPPEIQYVLNDGSGAFPGSIYRYVFPTSDRALRELAVADFDGDSGLEILASKALNAAGGPPGLELFDLDFSGAAPSITSLRAWAGGGTSAREGLAVGDLDLDGDLDFWCPNRLYENDGTGQFTYLRNVGGAWATSLQIGDVDGDGILDLVRATGVQCCADPGIEIFMALSSCTPQIAYREEQEAFPNRYAYFARIVDFNGDGRAEILAGFSGPFETRIIPVSPAGAPSQDASFQVDSSSHIGEAVDVNGDGRPDFVSVFGGSIRVRFNETSFRSGAAEYVQEPEWPLPGVPPRAIWVDKHNPGSNPDGSCAEPFAAIEDALAVASNSDVVYVRPGRYNCMQPPLLTLGQGVSLIGVGGPDVTSIEGVEIECLTGSYLSGFTLVNRGDMTSEAMITCRGAEIRGNVLLGYGAVHGIVVQDALPSRIVSNVVHFCSTGIVIQATTTLGTYYPTAEIYYNTIVENREGIRYQQADILRIVGNLIVNNNTYGIRHDCVGLTMNELLVKYNYIAGNRSGNVATTIVLPQTSCNSAIPLVADSTNTTAANFNSAWFVDAAGDDFHLVPNCPLRDQGDPSPFPLWLRTDVDGDPRTMPTSIALPFSGGSIPDIGADEVGLGRLEIESDGSSVTFVTRGLSPNLREMKWFAVAPGLLPLGPPLNSQLLLNPFAILYTTDLVPPILNGEVPLVIPLTPGMCGTRVFVQGLIVDPLSLQGVFTNAVAYTTR